MCLGFYLASWCHWRASRGVYRPYYPLLQKEEKGKKAKIGNLSC